MPDITLLSVKHDERAELQKAVDDYLEKGGRIYRADSTDNNPLSPLSAKKAWGANSDPL